MDIFDMCIRDLKYIRNRCKGYRCSRTLDERKNANVRLVENYITGMMKQIGEE